MRCGGRIRSRALTVALSLLFVLLIYMVYQVFSYLIFWAQQVAALAASEGVSLANAARLLDDNLAAETGSGGLVGYFRMVFATGIWIGSRVGINNQHVAGTGVLAYWILDLVLLSLMIVGGTWTALQRPFCSICGAYYGHFGVVRGRYGLDPLGHFAQASEADLIRLLKADRLEQAGSLIQAGKGGSTDGDTMVERCSTCRASPITLYVFQKSSQLAPTLVRPLTAQQFDRLTTFAPVTDPSPGGGVGHWARDMAIFLAVMAALLIVLAYLNW
jgi:hypothetical protein